MLIFISSYLMLKTPYLSMMESGKTGPGSRSFPKCNQQFPILRPIFHKFHKHSPTTFWVILIMSKTLYLSMLERSKIHPGSRPWFVPITKSSRLVLGQRSVLRHNLVQIRQSCWPTDKYTNVAQYIWQRWPIPYRCWSQLEAFNPSEVKIRLVTKPISSSS